MYASVHLHASILVSNRGDTIIKIIKEEEHQGIAGARKKYSGILVVAEGSDASGSGTAISALKNWAISKKFVVFDIVDYWAKHNTYPTYEEIKGCDAIIAREPSNIWIGAGIRNELIRKGKNYTYSALITAMAYGIDREILYRRLLGPALFDGKIVFSERSFISSIVYQPLHAKFFTNEKITANEILALPGNEFVFKHYSPDLLFVQQSSSEEVMKRLKTRIKQDNCAYEEEAFQEEISRGYSSEWLKQLLEAKGTKIHYIDTTKTGSPEKTAAEAIRAWERFYSDKKNIPTLNNY